MSENLGIRLSDVEQQRISDAIELAKEAFKQWPFDGSGNGQSMVSTPDGSEVIVTIENFTPVDITIRHET